MRGSARSGRPCSARAPLPPRPGDGAQTDHAAAPAARGGSRVRGRRLSCRPALLRLGRCRGRADPGRDGRAPRPAASRRQAGGPELGGRLGARLRRHAARLARLGRLCGGCRESGSRPADRGLQLRAHRAAPRATPRRPRAPVPAAADARKLPAETAPLAVRLRGGAGAARLRPSRRPGAPAALLDSPSLLVRRTFRALQPGAENRQSASG
jgi:hypothetical protein